MKRNENLKLEIETLCCTKCVMQNETKIKSEKISIQKLKQKMKKNLELILNGNLKH
jgi:formylmethanofuran dehydrogenase subunit C